jgi:hypothetical protein
MVDALISEKIVYPYVLASFREAGKSVSCRCASNGKVMRKRAYERLVIVCVDRSRRRTC